MRQAVAATERLRHCVAESEAGEGQRPATSLCSGQELLACLAVVSVDGNPRQRTTDQACAFESPAIPLLVATLDVERLGAVRERVHRGPDRLGAREVERQLRVVDDAG